jgi:hypothetical protein
MAQAVSRQHLTVAAWVHTQANPLGFVVDKVALGTGFSPSSSVSPVNNIPLWDPLFRKLKKKVLSFTPSLILIQGWRKGP